MLMKIRMPQLMLWLTTVLTSAGACRQCGSTRHYHHGFGIAQKVMPETVESIDPSGTAEHLKHSGQNPHDNGHKEYHCSGNLRVMGPCFLTTFSILKSLEFGHIRTGQAHRDAQQNEQDQARGHAEGQIAEQTLYSVAPHKCRCPGMAKGGRWGHGLRRCIYANTVEDVTTWG